MFEPVSERGTGPMPLLVGGAAVVLGLLVGVPAGLGEDRVRALGAGVMPWSSPLVAGAPEAFPYPSDPLARLAELAPAHAALVPQADALAEAVGWWALGASGAGDTRRAVIALDRAGRRRELLDRARDGLDRAGVRDADLRALALLHVACRLDLDLALASDGTTIALRWTGPGGDALVVDPVGLAPVQRDGLAPLDAERLDDLVRVVAVADAPVDEVIDALSPRGAATREPALVRRLHVALVSRAEAGLADQPAAARGDAEAAVALVAAHADVGLPPVADVLLADAWYRAGEVHEGRAAIDRALAAFEAGGVGDVPKSRWHARAMVLDAAHRRVTRKDFERRVTPLMNQALRARTEDERRAWKTEACRLAERIATEDGYRLVALDADCAGTP
jgi:hypothetical protein